MNLKLICGLKRHERFVITNCIFVFFESEMNGVFL